MLIKKKLIKGYLSLSQFSFSTISKIKSKLLSKKKGNIYIKSTNRNIFCTLIDIEDKKIKTSCSMRVPEYENEFNERENLFDRGKLLGELFGDKIFALGFVKVAILFDSNVNQGRRGFLRGLGNKKIKISLIQIYKNYAHNGCRPSKMRRKKSRTRLKIK